MLIAGCASTEIAEKELLFSAEDDTVIIKNADSSDGIICADNIRFMNLSKKSIRINIIFFDSTFFDCNT